MLMKKTGKTADDIFTRTTATAKQAVEKPIDNKMGRPPAHDEARTKATVVLFKRQILYLDQLAFDIRTATGNSISRAEIIRALIDALELSNVDLTKVPSEAEMKAILVEQLKED